MNIGICDDEKEYRNVIRQNCERYAVNNSLQFTYKIFMSGEQLIEFNEEIDILFLDIEMSGMSGIKIMELLEGRDSIRRIIFVSSHDEYIFDTYSAKTRGFVRKPILFDEFKKRMNKVICEITEDKVYMFETDGEKKYIKLNDLIYFKGMGNYVRVIGLNEEYTVYGNIKYWNEQLKESGIVRVHKSYMVNLRYVRNWKKSLYIEEINIEIPVGRRFYLEGEKMFQQYLLKRMRGA